MSRRKETRGEADSERLMPNERIAWGWIKIQFSRYIFASKFVSEKVCLDIACGSGYGSDYLVRNGARMVVGGDISKDGIEYARTQYTQDGLYFLLTDAQQLPFRDEGFDVVVRLETIEHLKDPGQFLSECYRVLRPSGRLILSTPNKAIYDHPEQNKPTPFNPFHASSYHIREFCIGELRSLAEEAHFQEMAIYGQDFIKKDIAWRFKVLAMQVFRCLILSLPKGQSIIYFLNRFFFKKRYVKLEDVDEDELKGIKDDNIIPLAQKGSLGEPTNIILVARK